MEGNGMKTPWSIEDIRRNLGHHSAPSAQCYVDYVGELMNADAPRVSGSLQDRTNMDHPEDGEGGKE